MLKKLLLFSVVFLFLVANVSAINITTCTEFQDINQTIGVNNNNYDLLNDIDCSGIPNFNQLSGSGGYFNGTFNGNGYTISNISINASGNYASIFGRISYSGGHVNDVDFVNVDVDGGSVVGCLAGHNYGTIDGVTCSGIVRGAGSVGGLVGEQYADWSGAGFEEGWLFNSHFVGDVHADGSSYVGGLVGYTDGKVVNSSATGDIYAEGVGMNYVGGVVGEAYYDGFGSSYAEITNSYYSGDIFASDDDYVGGISGDFYGFILNSYSEGTITGNNYVGGITGYQYSDFVGNSTITNSYSTSDVTGQNFTGGVVGELDQQSILTNVYASGIITGDTSVGGVLGSLVDGECVDSFWDNETTTQTTSACGTGKNTADMKTDTTFTNWDIAICSPTTAFIMDGYPCLSNVDVSCNCSSLLDSGNYTIVSGFLIADDNADVLNENVDIDYDYETLETSPSGQIILDTTDDISSVTNWFMIFVTIGGMVVLVLLTIIIITAIRGSGLMSGGGA